MGVVMEFTAERKQKEIDIIEDLIRQHKELYEKIETMLKQNCTNASKNKNKFNSKDADANCNSDLKGVLKTYNFYQYVITQKFKHIFGIDSKTTNEIIKDAQEIINNQKLIYDKTEKSKFLKKES